MSVTSGKSRWAWILAVCGVLLLPSERSALACSCGWAPLEETLSAVDVVFIGEVCGDTLVDRTTDEYTFTDRIIGFRVVQSWKGVAESRFVEISTALGSGFCGFDEREAGELFLVFAHRHSETGALVTSQCSGTIEICDGCSSCGQDDISQFEPLGYFPLIADGPTTDEILDICEPDAFAREFLESDSCELQLNLNHPFAHGVCGLGGFLPLACTAGLVGTSRLVRRGRSMHTRRWALCLFAFLLLSMVARESQACDCTAICLRETP